MAYSPSEKYPGAVDSDPNYQGGKFRDNNPSTTNNGSPLKAIDRNELLARDEAIMNDAGFEYNGLPDTPQDSQMFRAYKASLGNGANLLSNHNFLIQTPDDSQPLPSSTPTSYPPGHQIFSGVFANETSGITNLTYIDGRVSFSGGDLYFAVPNTGAIARLDSSQLVASVADFDGKPRTRGVSFGLVGNEYRVTVGIDALEDSEANETLLGSVKFEQGSVATWHESESLSARNLSDYTDIVYSSVDNMIAEFAANPLMRAVGTIIKTGGTTWEYSDSTGPITINNFRAFNAVNAFDFGLSEEATPTENSDAIDKTLNAAYQIRGSAYFPGGYYDTERPMVITEGITIEGDGAGTDTGTTFHSSGSVFSGRGALEIDAILNSKSIDNLKIIGIRFDGDTSHEGMRFISDINYSISDCSFIDMDFHFFDVGMRLAFSWDCLFQHIRVQGTNQPLRADSQVNSCHFDSVSLVSFNTAISFNNAEGLVFTAPDISNCTAPYTMTLFQSYIQLNTPYFELNNDIATVGASSEAAGSSLVITGGILTGDVVANTSKSVVNITGGRSATIGATKVTTSSGTPTYNIQNITYNITGSDVIDVSPNKEAIVESFYGNPNNWAAIPGSSLIYNIERDYYTITNASGGATGIWVTVSDLAPGEQYTFFAAVRVDATPSLRDGVNTLNLEAPTTSEDWSYQLTPFIANGNYLQLIFTGELQVKGLCIYKGLVNTGDVQIPIPEQYQFNAIPTAGNWIRGDTVFNKDSSIGQPMGWMCVSNGSPGAWAAMPNLS